MKALVFCDDDGHMGAVDMSTPEQEHKILTAMCQEAAKAGRLNAQEKKEIKELLANKDCAAIYDYLEEKDIVHIGQRGGPSVVEVATEWDGFGILNL